MTYFLGQIYNRRICRSYNTEINISLFYELLLSAELTVSNMINAVSLYSDLRGGGGGGGDCKGGRGEISQSVPGGP